MSVKGVALDLGTKNLSVTSVKSSDARFEDWLSPEGTFKFQNLFSMEAPHDKYERRPEVSELTESGSSDWQISINDVMFEDYGMSMEDRTLAKPIRVNLEHLSNQKGSQVDVSLAFNVDQTGEIEINGKAGIDPVFSDLTVQVIGWNLEPLRVRSPFPSLRVEVKEFADDRNDRLALAEKEIQKVGQPVPDKAADMTLSEDESTQLMAETYESAFGEHPLSLLADGQEPSPYDGKVPPAVITETFKESGNANQSLPGPRGRNTKSKGVLG